MRPRSLVVLATTLVIAGCGGNTATSGSGSVGPSVDLPRHVVVFSPDDLDDDAFYSGDPTWTPTAADVRRADAALRARVARTPEITTPYVEFVRQVTGLEDDTVLVNALCDADSVDWRREWITVADGGACFWQAAVRDGVVVSFSVNGEA